MLYVGTSGWQYRHWKQSYYPAGVRQADWLAFYTGHFQTVELNNSFYHLPAATSFARWRRDTPDDFVVAVKMSRFLTHVKRLREPEEPVHRFLERARHLGPKLGPVLVQLPPQMAVDEERLAAALALFPSSVRVAVEFRHDSWYTDAVRRILESRGAALCLADTPRRRMPFWRTAGWGFVRFHEGRATPRPCYGERALDTWAERIAGMWAPDQDVFAFFNNDPRACALRDAITFSELAARRGLLPTRVPPREAVTVDRG